LLDAGDDLAGDDLAGDDLAGGMELCTGRVKIKSKSLLTSI
jgi:hypothetical protein